MASTRSTTSDRDIDLRDRDRRVDDRDDVRRMPETKTFLASSEFWVTAIAIAALMVAAYAMNDIRNGVAWRYGTFVAIAYIISRGLAKAGSQRMYDRPVDRY